MTGKIKKQENSFSSPLTGDKRGASSNRRSFLKKVILFVFGAEAAYLLFDFFKGNDERIFEPEDMFEVGHLNDFEPNRIYPFSSGKFYIYKFDDGGIIAISYRCTHLGCTIRFDEDRGDFVCPCHASAFNIKGEVLSPPATRPLDSLPLVIKNGLVKVDVNHPKKRKRFERSQLVYG
jgi:nitrite reductase/ring-hydroxylating ferredoxin subunit